MTEQLFFRHGGTPSTPIGRDRVTGKAFTVVPQPCSRCGGLGGSDAWKHTGWKCYKCGGSGKGDPKTFPLYTSEQIEKLNAAQAKRDEKKRQKYLAAEAKRQAEADARRGEFYALYGPLLVAAKRYVERSEFVGDVVRKAELDYAMTPRQTVALANSVHRMAAADAEKEARVFVGKVGERLKKLNLTAVHCASIPVPSFSGYGTASMNITTLRDGAGNVFVVKSSSFWAEKGEELVLSGTVKEHSIYKGERQTRLERVKVLVAL